jgi:presequence protease
MVMTVEDMWQETCIQSMPLRTEDVKIQDWKAEMDKFSGAGEGFIVPTQVNYVGKGAPLFEVGETTSGAAAVVSRYLRNSYLWDKVRVVGGAYGAMNSYNPTTGMYKYVSYRDPNLMQTLQTYDETPEFLRELSKEMSPTTLANAIIGMIGDMDAPMSPDQKGFSSMDRWLCGNTDEMRQERREQVLGTTAKVSLPPPLYPLSLPPIPFPNPSSKIPFSQGPLLPVPSLCGPRFPR